MVVEEPGIVMKEHGFHIHQTDSVPSRSSSAPPSVEGSFAAVRTHLIDQNIRVNPGDFENAVENVVSGEQLPSDPANSSCYVAAMDLNLNPADRIGSFRGNRVLNSTDDNDDETLHFSRGSASTHRRETDEDSLPPRASEDVAESSIAAMVGKNASSSASRHKSVVDLIQEDFPRTPSPVYNQSRTSSHTKTDELDDDANATKSSKLSGIDKTPDPSSQSSEPTQSGVPFSTSLPSSFHLDETGKLPRDESSDKYVNRGYSSASGTPRRDSRTNLEIKTSQEKQQNHRKNVPRARGQAISQGMHQLAGFTPLYTEASAFMGSENHFVPNLQPSDLFAPQYNLPGYASGSTIIAPFMSGYSPQGWLPFLSSSGYVDRVPHVGDVRQQSRFYRQQVLMPPQALAQTEPTFSAFVGDQKLHLPPNGTLYVPIPINTEIRGYGNFPFANAMSQLPSSSQTGPITPSSYHGGHQIEMMVSRGSVRNPGTYSELHGKRGFGDSDGRKKLSVLEELKSGCAQNIELSNIEGRVVDFSFDQHGSRFIQKKLEHCSAEDKMSVFKEVVPHASRLMVDAFGNFVVQKILERGSAEQRKEIADALSGQMLTLSLQVYGCRVIQKALEVIEPDQKSLLVKELDGHVMECTGDQNGNHVIQKCIECLPTEEIGFIISSFQGHVRKLASHPYGCRVIQRVLEHCLNDIQCQCIIEEILENSSYLAEDQYGNYVIQHILQWGKPRERSQIIKKLAGSVVPLSQQKFASNVIEKCLEYGDTTEQELLIDEMLIINKENDNLLAMMKDQYANYVLQKILMIGNEKQKATLLDHTRLHIPALGKYTYGKHIAARCKQLSGEEFGRVA